MGVGGSIEAVLIPMLHRKGTRRHITLCVSSQVGCAMNCQFCYTGRMGLSGNLSTAQIVEQVRGRNRLQGSLYLARSAPVGPLVLILKAACVHMPMPMPTSLAKSVC